MAARLPTACLVLAALWGVGWWVPPAAAKPPDLPIQEKIDCDPLTPAAGAVPQTGEEEDDVHARAAQFSALRTASRCLLFAAHPLLSLLPVDEWLADDDEAGTRAQAPAGDYVLPPANDPRFRGPPAVPPELLNEGSPKQSNFTCPYLREKADREQASSPLESAEPGTVLDNLDKLEQAAKLYRQARFYERTGHPAAACFYCEKIHALCPGSRYDLLAGKELERLHAEGARPAAEAAGEEEEAPPQHPKAGGCGRKNGKKAIAVPEEQAPCPKEEKQSSRNVEPEVAALLEHCQSAYVAGRYAEAETLARHALALDPDTVAAHPLVYKLHLLTLLQDKPEKAPPVFLFSGEQRPEEVAAQRQLKRYAELFKEGLYAEAELCALQALALDPQNPTVQAAIRLAAMQRLAQSFNYQTPPCPWAAEPRVTMRQPELPPVDPTVVGALDQVLTTVGEPTTGAIAVTVEEQGKPEGQAKPADADVPTVVLDSPGDDPVERAAQYVPLQDLVDTLRSVVCAEVDSFPRCDRGRCHLSLGCLVADVSWDSRGEHGSFLMGVGVADPTPDLRAEQWEHNERVTRWIERHGACYPACRGGNEACEDPEDADQP